MTRLMTLSVKLLSIARKSVFDPVTTFGEVISGGNLGKNCWFR